MRHLDPDGSATETVLPGALWSVALAVTDDRGYTASDTLSVLVVDQLGAAVLSASVTITRPYHGRYRINVTGLVDPGDYLITVTGTDDIAEFTVEVLGDAVPAPDLESVKAYVGDDVAAQFTDAEISEALAAERGRQRDNCTIPARYPAALREALHRRVQRNLAMKALPLALQSEADGTAIRLGANDPVVRDIEARYPKMVAG